MTILTCLSGALLVGAFWGTIDLFLAFLAAGGGAGVRALLFILTVYTVSALLLATVLSLLARAFGLPAERTIALTLALLFSLFGGGFIATYTNLRFLNATGSATRILVNVGLLALFACLVLVSRRVATRVARSPRRLALACVVFAIVVWSGTVATALRPKRHAAPPAQPAAAPAATQLPNLVLLVEDTLRADHLSSYGYRAPTAPNLDAIRRDGILFLRTFAQCSWTKPSTTSLMTSLYPSAHGVNEAWSRLPEESTTLAELLKQRGYATAAFSANPHVSPAFGLGQGFDYFYETQDTTFESFFRFVTVYSICHKLRRRVPALPFDRLMNQGAAWFGLGEEKLTNCQRDAAITRRLSTWLSEHRDRPFFVYVHYMCPHYPYEPPDSEKLDWQMPVIRKGLRISDDKRNQLIATYDKTIVYADKLIATVTADLRTLGLYDKTVLAITADHGDEFFEHGQWGHHKTLYDEVLHVPLVVRYPPLVPSGQTVAEPVRLVDVMPTFLAVADVAVNGSLEGRNLLAPPPATHHHAAYAELISEGRVVQALIKGTHKYIRTTGPDSARNAELYDVGADPGEQQNLWDGTTDQVRSDWEAGVKGFARQTVLKAEDAVVPEEQKERLRALGYIH